MKGLRAKNEATLLAVLCMLTYMASYLTRINFGAVISEMESATGLSRSLLSMSVTGSFITYGVGQIISGVMGDKYSPKKLISLGFVMTIIMNLIIPLCTSPYQMLVVWCINGFAQSFMWPPLVKIMTTYMSDEEYKRGTLIVSWGSAGGTILIYLVSPLIIALSGYKAVFLFSAVCGIIMLLVWNKFAKDVDIFEEKSKVKAVNGGASAKLFIKPFMLCIMIAIVLQGMLRDGVTTWMPTYIAETYNLSNVISILTGVILPIFTIICLRIGGRLYKVITNPLTCSGVIFTVGVVSSLMLYLLNGQNAAFSVLLSAVLTGSMHGVNLILICMVPAFFKNSGYVSTVSGVLNACTYVGSAISTYGIALLSERVGWSNTVLMWALIAIAGTIICFADIKPWKKGIERL